MVECKGDIKNGWAVCRWPDGSIYEGYWKDGQKHGQGKYIWANGMIYEGGFVEGLKDGHGKLRQRDGEVYDGFWSKGKKHGHGKVIYLDGRVDEGQWNMDEFLGELQPTVSINAVQINPRYGVQGRYQKHLEEIRKKVA